MGHDDDVSIMTRIAIILHRGPFFCFLSLVRRYHIRPQDADKLAHAVYEPGSRASEEIASEFGGGVVLDCPGGGDVQIDRKKLGAIVFGDPASMSVRK